MELKELKFYLACVECGSLGKAAEKLYTSQPNVSKVIRSLEDELGAALFDRTSKGMILTPFGKMIYEYAKRCVENAEELQALTQSHQADAFSISTYRSNVMARILAKQYRETPDMRIEHREGSMDEVLENVERGISEIGIVYVARRHYKTFLNTVHRKKLEFHLLDYRDTCIYVGPNSPLYDRKAVTFEELSQERFLFNLSETFSLQEGIEHDEMGLIKPQTFRMSVRTNSEHFAATMLAETDILELGIYLEYPVETPRDVRAIYINGEDSRAALGVVVSAGHMLSPHAKKFVDNLSEMFMMKAWENTVPE